MEDFVTIFICIYYFRANLECMHLYTTFMQFSYFIQLHLPCISNDFRNARTK